MNLPAELYSLRLRQNARRPICQEDLSMFEALTGKSAAISSRPINVETSVATDVAPVQTIAQRWKPSVNHIAGRLRSMYEHGVKHPPVVDWLKQVSEHAFTRLDEAQVRLNAARPEAVDTHRVERVILTIRPEEPSVAVETNQPAEPHYKRVA